MGPQLTGLDIIGYIPVGSIRRIEIHFSGDPGVGVAKNVAGSAGVRESVVMCIRQPGEGELAVVIHAHDAISLLFSFRQRGQEEARQDRDNRDDNEQFDESES